MAGHGLTISWRTAAWPALIGISIFALHLPEFLHRLLDGDEAIYGSIAVLMNMGGALYGSGGVDNKPPGVFWVYAATFRGLGAYPMAAIHTTGFLALIAGAALISFSGSVTGFWRWTVGTLVGYASTSWTPAYVWLRAKDSIVPFLLDMAVFWIAAIALAARWRGLAVQVRLVVVWLVVAMTGSLAGGHLSWHYFIQALGPPAVL